MFVKPYTFGMDNSAAAAAAQFKQAFGVEPAGVWSAPGRVNLIGEHTDYNRGLCLPIALPQRAWLAASRRDDDVLNLHAMDTGDSITISISDISPSHPDGWASYQAGVVWAMRQAGLPVGGINAVLKSDVPIGSGLSSSAAIEGCLAVAASSLYGLGLTADDLGRAQLAALCQRGENEIAGAPTGGLDQSASLRAQASRALLIDFNDLDAAGLPSATQVPFDFAADGMVLLVINTNARHSHVDGQYGARRQACQEAATALGVASLREVSVAELPAALAKLTDARLVRATRHVVTETARVTQAVDAAQNRNWSRVGELFDASHHSLRDDYRVSCDELDVACEVAKSCGAAGARMTGGGFGGSAIALIAGILAPDVAPKLVAEYEQRGWHQPDVFAVEASDGAE